jgi:transglutaminase-like putative cysteine protease
MIIDISHTLNVPAGTGARAVEHLLLTPLSGATQTVKDWRIEMPGIETAARFTDAYGNRAILVTQAKPEGEIKISVRGQVEVEDRNGVLGRLPGEPVVGLYRRVTALTEADPRIVDGFAQAERYGTGRIALLHAVMDRIGELYRFEGTREPAPEEAGQHQQQSSEAGTQSQSQTAAEASIDSSRTPANAAVFAHAFVGTIRALGLPARYVTGYFAGDEDTPAAFHAWAEAYDDSLGWIAFDAALGLCPTDRHVRIAVGLDGLSTQAVRVVPADGEAKLVEISVVAQSAQ